MAQGPTRAERRRTMRTNGSMTPPVGTVVHELAADTTPCPKCGKSARIGKILKEVVGVVRPGVVIPGAGPVGAQPVRSKEAWMLCLNCMACAHFVVDPATGRWMEVSAPAADSNVLQFPGIQETLRADTDRDS